MRAEDCIAALELPDGALVNQRIPKKTLAENGASTAATRRQIQEGIEELRWIAVLKPTTVGIPEYRDSLREYLEIAVLHLRTRPPTKSQRLTGIVHRAIPYPVVLVTSSAEHTELSLAHKRWSQSEKGQVVLDGEVEHVQIDLDMPEGQLAGFRSALSMARQPRGTLHELYQGWLNTALSLRAADVLGEFALPVTPGHAEKRRDALVECARLETEMASLRAAAKSVKQLPRQVELNLQLKRLSEAHAAARAQI